MKKLLYFIFLSILIQNSYSDEFNLSLGYNINSKFKINYEENYYNHLNNYNNNFDLNNSYNLGIEYIKFLNSYFGFGGGFKFFKENGVIKTYGKHFDEFQYEKLNKMKSNYSYALYSSLKLKTFYSTFLISNLGVYFPYLDISNSIDNSSSEIYKIYFNCGFGYELHNFIFELTSNYGTQFFTVTNSNGYLSGNWSDSFISFNIKYNFYDLIFNKTNISAFDRAQKFNELYRKKEQGEISNEEYEKESNKIIKLN
ncbi:hypothetical protein [Haliovirga abyssi]|uniref:Outer membrane protein beta-barrel domain-containing protein n=1 Tax=Haliovirga abyssi TaxID=2996794 RepID=A0AAU9DC03_9FUSO|nr:hypothetical protein [Haliovirga abyssi]BDU50830.1 hypothetical protein HLVA_13990 [Haliovirga abyssi]